MAFKINTVEFGTQRADQFHANPLNPRVHPQHQRDVINASLKRFGFIAPVIVSKRSGYLIDGHERVWQALAEGDDTLVPYVEADVEEDHEAELILSYDKSTMLAEYDPVNLQALMEQVNTDDEVLAKLFADMKEEYIPIPDEPLPDNPPSIDKAGELQVKWNTERGQLWLIPSKHGGEHRLLCGDSTVAEDVDRVMDGKKADAVITDPPYGVNYIGGRNPESNTPRPMLKNDDTDLYTDFLKVLINFVSKRAVFYIWFADRNGLSIYTAVDAVGLNVRSMIVWHKLKAHYGNFMAQYLQKHEPCLYCVQNSTDWYGATNEVSVWEINQPSHNEHHLTEKPIECMSRPMSNSTKRGDIVVDPFGGSGTTMVACEQLGRLCRMIEIEPKYVAVILERMATLGLEPRLA